MVGTITYRPGTWLSFEEDDPTRLATNADWRAYNAGDKSVVIGMGPDGNFRVITPQPEKKIESNNGGSSFVEPVKIAEPTAVQVLHEKAFSNEKMLEALFEDMGIQEILSVTRNSAMNIVNGQNILYQPIKNVANLTLEYNPFNLLPIQSSDTIFKNFSIVLEDKLVEDGGGTGPNGETEYLDTNNNLVINVTNMEADQIVEIESLIIEKSINDTIYIGATS